MARPRLLIPISIQFSVRYLLRTGLLDRLREHADLVILLAWDDPELSGEFRAAGDEVHLMPKAHWGRGYERIRGQVRAWHESRLRSPSTVIDNRRFELGLTGARRARRRLRMALIRTRLALPGQVKALRTMEREALEQDTNIEEIADLIRGFRIDDVFSLTPYLRDEEMVLRACADLGIPLCAAILSFDNITTRGWMPITFDSYLLWNALNAAELRRAYPETSERSIAVVGAPQFDFYYDPNYIWEQTDWRRRLGIPPDRPVILFGGGHYQIVPVEPSWLAQLDDAIEHGAIPDRPIILFRRHPIDPPERWHAVLGRARHVIADDPWPSGKSGLGQTNIRRIDIERLASTLHYSKVHLNASSTMSVDGAILDRPQVGPAYDDQPGRPYDRAMRELYLREHYLPITRSGGLDIAYSREEMVAAVISGLSHPTRGAEGRKAIVRAICTFDDGRSTDRVAHALRGFIDRGRV